MPLIGTFGSAGSQSFGSRGLLTGGSAEFNSANDYLTAPAGTAFQYGTGDFTIEMWIYPTTNNSPSGNGVTIFRQRGANYNTQRYLFMFLWPTNQIFLQVPGNDFFVGTQNLVTLNAWNHVALVRRSGSMRIFLNGIANPAAVNTTNYSDASAYNLAFGNLVFNTTYTFVGYMTNIRVAKSAYYTATFEPSRTPFTRTSQGATNVQLLLNCRNTSTLATDSSANNITVTNNLVTFNSRTPYNVPYVVPPAFTPVTAVITPSATTINEGSTITFTVVGTNTSNGTYYWTVEQGEIGTVSAADFNPASLSGSFTITTNSGSFTITPTKDLLTEGSETFVVFVRQTSITGTVIGNTETITITDTSLTPAFTVAPASVDEGSSAAFTVQNVGPDGTYFWTVLNGTSANSDFTSTSGSFTVSGSTGGIDNGTGSFSVSIVADRTTETIETFQVQVRSGSTSGTVLLTSSSVTINDTSLTPEFNGVPNGNAFDEGVTTSFTVANLGPAGTYYWTILNGTTVDADFSAVSGSFTTSTLNGNGTILITALADRVTEGQQTFQIQVRTGSTSGTVILTSQTFTVRDVSLTPSLVANTTQIREATIATSSIPNSVIFTASNLGPAGTYYWTLNGLVESAVLDGLQGAFQTLTENGSADITVRASAVDVIQESTGTFTLSVRQGSTGGTIIVTSPSVSLLDSTIVVNLISSGGFAETLVTEGVPMSIRFTTGPGCPAGTYYWEIVNVDTTNADFATVNGTFSTTGEGQIVTLSNALVTVSNDGAEAGQSFRIRVRFENASGQTVGEGGNFTILANAT